jgi:hypothetical protein
MKRRATAVWRGDVKRVRDRFDMLKEPSDKNRLSDIGDQALAWPSRMGRVKFPSK